MAFLTFWCRPRIERLFFLEKLLWLGYNIVWKNGTSRMIGARALSEHAHALELAAKENDGAAVLASHAPFMAAYDALVKGLLGMIG